MGALMAVSETLLSMDLEQFRLEKGLTYDQLADLIGLTQNRQAQAYALGETWPKTERLDVILRKTDGLVTILAMHERRRRWLASHKRQRRALPPTRGRDTGQRREAR